MRGIVGALETKAAPKPIVWVTSSKDDLRSFPDDIKERVGHALWFAQTRRTHDSVKALKGFGGAGVLEVVALLPEEVEARDEDFNAGR